MVRQREDDLRARLQKLQKLSRTRPGREKHRPGVLEDLEGVVERDGVLIAMTTWPSFRAAWEDPRYDEMLGRLNLTNPRRGKAPQGQ